MKKAMLLAFVCAAGCGGSGYDNGSGPAVESVLISDDTSELNNETVQGYFARLRAHPAPKVWWYKNCTIRYESGSISEGHASFSGKVLVHLHADPRTGEKYYPHFDHAWFTCDSLKVLVRDGGSLAYRFHLSGDVVFLRDAPAWARPASSATFDMVKDTYTSGGRPLHLFEIEKKSANKIGGGHGSGMVSW